MLLTAISLCPAHASDQGACIVLGDENHNIEGNHPSQSSVVHIFLSIITVISFTSKETVFYTYHFTVVH